jgi:hypothetical protein
MSTSACADYTDSSTGLTAIVVAKTSTIAIILKFIEYFVITTKLFKQKVKVLINSRLY